jgi:hypothetical protein
MIVLKLDKKDGRFCGYHFERAGVRVSEKVAIEQGYPARN